MGRNSPLIFVILAAIAIVVHAQTTSGSTQSSSISIPTISVASVSSESPSESPSTSDPPIHHHHGHAKTYSVSSSPSVDTETGSTSTNPLDGVVIPASKLFVKSSLPSTIPEYSSEAQNSSDESSLHFLVEKTHFKHNYIMAHSHEVSSSVIEDLESQFSEFESSISSSVFDSSAGLFVDENFHDDQDSDAITGGTFLYRNVLCILPNGTGFEIPNVPCSRNHKHENQCNPLCAESWNPHCTPTCYCRTSFNTDTFTDAAILNCTKGFVPLPTRAANLRTTGVIIGVTTAGLASALTIPIFMVSNAASTYGLTSFVNQLFGAVREAV
jgi:hypothetical protein